MSESMTLERYLSTPETNRRRELMWGVVREPAAPTWDHQFVLGRLFQRIDSHVRRLRLGKVGLAPIDVILDAERKLVVQPDLFFVAAARCKIISDRVWGAPDLVVEVVSKGSLRYDQMMKRDWYRQYGVRELWLSDPREQTVSILDLSGDTVATADFTGTQVLRSRVLPRLRLRALNAFV